MRGVALLIAAMSAEGTSTIQNIEQIDRGYKDIDGRLNALGARITRHISLNCCRDRSRLKRSAFISELSAELEQCIPAPDNAACRMDDLALETALNAFLGKLDEEKRNIFVRRYWFLDSVADIAKRYGISESKVKTTLFRCRNRLRKYLNKEGYTV